MRPSLKKVDCKVTVFTVLCYVFLVKEISRFEEGLLAVP